MSNSKIINNSIWPNGIQVDSEGYAVFYPMGTNKVNIPKNSPHWPKGNKLIGQFVYDKNNKLVGFCDTKAMTSTNNGEIIVMPYEEIDTDFDSISNGDIQIHAPKATVKKASWNGSGEKIDIPDVDYKYKGCKTADAIKTKDENYLENDIVDGKWTELLSDLTSGGTFNGCETLISFTSDLSSLTNGSLMFYMCDNLTNFTSDLSSLTNGHYMFYECSNLVSFISDLSSLSSGGNMFYGCTNLVSFTSDLSSLTNGNGMFYGCSNLTSFISDLGSLTSASQMFFNCFNLIEFNCSNLDSLTNGEAMFAGCHGFSSFGCDLSSLTKGNYMFQNCINFTSFNSNLSSLTNGNYMFQNCKLDVPSVKNIIDTINIVSSETESPSLHIGMGCNNNNEDRDLFAQEVGYSDMNTLLTALQNKGWTVLTQYTGRPSTNYSLRQPESLPVFVKLVEVSPDEEFPFYEYTSIDGSKFFNIDWFHETTGSTDGYDVFSSLEEAIAYFNIKQIEK